MDLGRLFTLGARLLVLSVELAVLSLLTIAVYRLLFHPLARIPGPRLAAISNIWQARHVRNGRVRELGKTLHKKYGPVVRVGPNEVWFNSGEAFKTIYSTDVLPILFLC
jgi:hypothetical protein